MKTIDPKKSNWTISLETPDYINSFLSRKSGPLQYGLSITMMSESPRVTYFSFQNWTHRPETLPNYTRQEYRTYLVLHECGHALGLGHSHCKGGPAPIMHQQTRGNKTCTKNTWPLAFEKRLLS
jgi:hypothetical protein